MAIRERQSYVQQPVLPDIQQGQMPSKVKKRRALITPIERALLVAFVVVVASLSIVVLHKQGELQKMTIDIQNKEVRINEVSKENVGLKVEVSELSKYDRIWEKAQALGLTLDEKNVKVVSGQ